MMRKILLAGLLASSGQMAVAADKPRGVPVALEECGFDEQAPIFGVGIGAGTSASPIMIPLEKQIIARGDKSASLRSIPVPALQIHGWTTDYAMMRLSASAGKPIFAITENGGPGDTLDLDIPATSLADAYDRIAAAKGLRWRYDGDKVYMLGGRAWSLPLPASRDLAIAVRDALLKNNVKATIEANMVRFQSDDSGAERVSAVVAQVYAEPRLNPYDVHFYRVYPSAGAIDWTHLADRTDAVESVDFAGKAATVVLDPTAGDIVGTFLATEGTVRSLGDTTMVAGSDGPASHVAGCGASAIAERGLSLAGGSYERGRMALTYSILGTSAPEAGKLAVAPGSVVVIADGEPVEGGYMVAVVRPRVLEMQGAPAGGPLPIVKLGDRQIASAD